VAAELPQQQLGVSQVHLAAVRFDVDLAHC
jgi:hypothetical protein